jgi:hypothetical protein
MTIHLEHDIETKLERFPQILERLPNLLAEQIALEEWREERYSAEARAIMADVLREPIKQKEKPEFARLEQAFARITPFLGGTDESGS